MSEIDAKNYLRSNLWPTGTRVQLLNVPWDSDYRDVVAWESAEARDQWFEEHLNGSWFETNFNYLWPNLPVAVPVPYSSAYKYNYIAVTNPAQPVDDEGPVRTYYYFITDVQYLSPQASNLMVQLDVMTTYCDSITLGNAFVERGHIAMANQNVSPNTYNEYLTVPEGLDCGSQYLPVYTEFLNACAENDYEDDVNEYAKQAVWGIIVSTADLTEDPGDTSSPNLTTASGGIFDNAINGCSVYAVEENEVTAVLHKLKTKSWVAQCIIDIYLIPGKLVRVSAANYDTLFGDSDGVKLYTSVLSSHSLSAPELENVVFTIEDIKDKAKALTGTPDKMLCYPYTVIEVSSLTGNPVYLKPELIYDNDLKFIEYGQASVPGPQFCLLPANYERNQQQTNISYDDNGVPVTLPWGSGLDSAVWLTDFPHISIVNNQYQLYLASTANTRRYNYESAGWMLDRTNMSAYNAYRNQADTLRMGYGNFNLQNTLAQNQAGENRVMGNVSAVVSGAAGIGGGIANGEFGSAAISAANMGLGVAQNELSYHQTMAQLSTNAQTTRNTLDTNTSINNRNYELAQDVAQGDYQNAIASINATVQDAALSAPSVVGQSGGNLFNFLNAMVGIRVTVKCVGGAARRTIKDYFLRYGYGVRRWLNCGSVRDMLCMDKFAYWKVLETSVVAADANEQERMTIRGVFEKGVTLWDDPSDIGNVNLEDNSPRLGYSY